MNYITMSRDNMSFSNTTDSIIIRNGVWNHMEIIFERSEFDENESNFNDFANLIDKLLNDEAISTDDYKSDPYVADIFDKLITYGIIKVKKETKLSKQKSCYIVEDEYKECAEFIFDATVLTISEIKPFLSEVLLNKIDYLEYEETQKNLVKVFSEYSHIVFISSQPHLSTIKEINRFCLYNKKPLSVAYVDGSFATICAFNAEHTGCFECLEQHNMVRMANLANYIDYRKSENSYAKYPLNRDTFLLLCTLINQVDKTNHYDISTPLEGKILSIYLPNFEILIEKIIRSPLCSACGHISKSISSDFNLSTKNALKTLLKEDFAEADEEANL